MSTMPSRFFAILLACWASRFAAAEAPPPMPAEGVDVAGVRIGMSKAQALRTAIDRLRVPATAVQSADPASFSIKTDKETLTVHLTTPADARYPQAVDRVTYEMPSTPRNAAGMKRAALQRYGSPSNGTRGFSLEWCRKSDPTPVDPGIGCLQAHGAVLKLSGTTIELSDPGFSDAAMQYANRQPSQFARF